MSSNFKISKLNKIFYVVFSGAILFTSCKKHGCADEYAVNYDSQAKKNKEELCIYNDPELEDYVPNFGPNTATLLTNSGKPYKPHPQYNYYQMKYFMRAAFYDVNNKAVSAGDVHGSELIPEPGSPWHYVPLNKHSNNKYSINRTLQLVGSMPNPLEWKGEGDVWPNFSLSTDRGFASYSSVLSGAPSVSSPYLFEVKKAEDADSLALIIHGQRKTIHKVIPSDMSQVVFSKEEIESVGKGYAVLKVISIRYKVIEESGRTYYFVNSRRVSKDVKILP